MNYRGFCIFYCRCIGTKREDKDGNIVSHDGYHYVVYSNQSRSYKMDRFDAAEGFELPDKADKANAELFAREMVDMQYKEYCLKRDRWLDNDE